jgi:hypothetical protein
MDFNTATVRRFDSSDRRRRQVRSLPFVSQLVEVGDLGLDLDPLDLVADLDPGFLPQSESWSAA